MFCRIIRHVPGLLGMLSPKWMLVTVVVVLRVGECVGGRGGVGPRVNGPQAWAWCCVSCVGWEVGFRTAPGSLVQCTPQ